MKAAALSILTALLLSLPCPAASERTKAPVDSPLCVADTTAATGTGTAAPHRSLDSTKVDYAPLDSLLNAFYIAMAPAPSDEKITEFDSLIESCRDENIRQHVATEIFEHYKEPRIMGDEAVSVHIYDRWFADGTVKLEGEFTKINAEMYANFNRATLIGCDAPEVELIRPNGRKSAIPARGRSALLFFYDTACAKCKLESKQLPGILAAADFPITVYAVYCGSDKRAWASFRRQFKCKNRLISIIHLWDPEIESNYLKLYGVMATPKMYFMEPGGSIIGRRLGSDSLEQLLPTAGAIDATYRKYHKTN